MKDNIIDKHPIKNGRNNRTLNECIEDWYASIEKEFYLFHKARKIKDKTSNEYKTALDEFTKNQKFITFNDLIIRITNDSYLNKTYQKEVKIIKPNIVLYEGINAKYINIMLGEISNL